MLSTSVKQKASTEMGWLQWWNPQADQNGELFSQRINEVLYQRLHGWGALLPEGVGALYSSVVRTGSLWSRCECGFWRPLVVPCFKCHDWRDVHLSKLSSQGLGQIVFSVTVQFLGQQLYHFWPALISKKKKTCKYYGRWIGVGLVFKSCLELFCLFWGVWSLVEECEPCQVSWPHLNEQCPV